MHYWVCIIKNLPCSPYVLKHPLIRHCDVYGHSVYILHVCSEYFHVSGIACYMYDLKCMCQLCAYVCVHQSCMHLGGMFALSLRFLVAIPVTLEKPFFPCSKEILNAALCMCVCIKLMLCVRVHVYAYLNMYVQWRTRNVCVRVCMLCRCMYNCACVYPGCVCV